MAVPAMQAGPIQATFPRFFNIGGHWINAYKVLLCVGLYVGSLSTAVLGNRSGLSPLAVGFGAMSCALAGLIGARVYHLVVHLPRYLALRTSSGLWDSRRGGWSVFGALLTFVPMSLAVSQLLAIPAAVLWDHMALGVLTGGFWIRCGCVFNGCCAGRETSSRIGVRLHDTRGVRKWRVPVQFLEMAWWLLGTGLFLWQWPNAWASGSYALAVLGWYGVGRFFLEPLRERPDVVFGRLRINQLVAALLALGAAAALVWLAS